MDHGPPYDHSALALTSHRAIHLMTASVGSGPALSRMRSTGFPGASEARVLNRIESASPIVLGA